MKTTLCAVLTIIAFGLARDVDAYPIAIVNASFESPDTSDVAHTVTGWTQGGIGGSGVWDIEAYDPGPPFWTVDAPDGSQVAFLSDAPADGNASTLSQVLSDTVAANTTYTLSGYVGHPVGFATVYSVSLLAGLTPVATTGPSIGPEGNFATFTIVFNSTLFPSLVNENLRIELLSLDAQTAFDDITLEAEAEAVPDGGLTALLFGIGMSGLGWMGRGRRKS